METGEPQVSKLEKITKADGSKRWVTSTKVPRYDNEGEIIGTMGISRDVTDRVRAERELQESEERYRRTIENANVGVGVYGPDRELKISIQR